MTKALKLEKKKPISLAKAIAKMKIGLGWDVLAGNALDLDVTAVALKSDGKVSDSADVCFYNQLIAANGALVSAGDDRTGGNSVDGDDEEIVIEFAKLPEYVTRIDVLVTIHNGKAKNQRFGLVNNAYAKIYNAETNEELFFIDLAESKFSESSVHVASLVKGTSGVWSVENVSNSFDYELDGILTSYGVPLE